MPCREKRSGGTSVMLSTPSRRLRQKMSRSGAPGKRPAIPTTATASGSTAAGARGGVDAAAPTPLAKSSASRVMLSARITVAASRARPSRAATRTCDLHGAVVVQPELDGAYFGCDIDRVERQHLRQCFPQNAEDRLGARIVRQGGSRRRGCGCRRSGRSVALGRRQRFAVRRRYQRGEATRGGLIVEPCRAELDAESVLDAA